MLGQTSTSGVGSRLEALQEHFGAAGISLLVTAGIICAVYVMIRGAGMPLLLLLVSYSLFFVEQGGIKDFAFFTRVLCLGLLLLAAVRKLERPTWHFWALMLYGFLNLVFSARSGNPQLALQKGGLLLVTIIGASLGLASFINSYKSIVSLYRMFVVSGVVWTVVSLIFMRDFMSGTDLRFAGGSEMHATNYAGAGAFLLPFMLWATLHGWNPVWRAMGVLGVLAIPVCLFLSGTRTAMVVGVITCGPILMRGSMLKSVGVWVLVAILGVAALFFGRSMLAGRNTNYISGRLTTVSLSGREYRWAFAIKECLKNPVFGRGAGANESVAQQIVSGGNFHNAYLSIQYNTGIVGLICVVSVLVSQGRRALTLMRRASNPYARDAMRVAFGLLLALGAIGLVENSFASSSGAIIAMFVMMSTLVDRVQLMSEQGQAYAPTRPLEAYNNPYPGPSKVGWSQ